MKTFTHYVFVILLVFNSCKKEDVQNPVSAGIYDDNFIYQEFSPSLKVELVLDTITDNFKGSDSIDINLDGIYDININQRIHIPPVSGIPSYEQFPYYRLDLKNGLEVATKIEYYIVGHGGYDNVNWIDTLDYEYRIDNISEWSEPNASRLMWAIPPIPYAVSNGCWYYQTNVVKYIGIRMKIGSKYKLGWIKVNEISNDDILFISCAMEK